MSWYGKHVLPRLVHLGCGTEPVTRQREKIVPRARGRVLEVGIGTGLNLPHYDPARVTRVWGLDPSPEMIRRAERSVESVGFEVEFIGLPGEEIPLDDDSVDTVVITYTLCSIPEAIPALRQMGRVLRPGGELLFCEHGAAPDASVRRWQDRLTPLWKKCAGGCHLNRAIPDLIEEAGFEIRELETMYLPGWRPGSFNYWGSAVHGGPS